MDAFKMKVLLLPLLGLGVVAGAGQFSSMNKSSKGANFGVLVAAYNRAQLADNDSDDDKDDSDNQVEGKVVRFWEGKELIINDGNGPIAVEYQEKWKPLNLRVGQPVSIRGSVSGNGSQRTLSASEIRGPNGTVYPQPSRATHVRADGLGPFIGANDSEIQPQTTPNGNLYMIREVVEKAPQGDVVVIKGEVVELPSDEILILRDVSGQISVDIDDAQKTLHLQKGDKVTVHGSLNEKKEFQAVQVEKN